MPSRGTHAPLYVTLQSASIFPWKADQSLIQTVSPTAYPQMCKAKITQFNAKHKYQFVQDIKYIRGNSMSVFQGVPDINPGSTCTRKIKLLQIAMSRVFISVYNLKQLQGA